MAGLQPQTLVNEFSSYYLRAGAGGEGVPSPFSIVDETPPTTGSRLTITNADNVTTMANVNNLASTRAQIVLGDAATLTSASAPVDGYNVRATSSNTRVAQPLVVQSGSVPGLVLSNSSRGRASSRTTTRGFLSTTASHSPRRERSPSTADNSPATASGRPPSASPTRDPRKSSSTTDPT